MSKKRYLNFIIKIAALLIVLSLAPWSSGIGAEISRFIIGQKSFDGTQFSCDGYPGCYIKNFECKWDVTLCDKQCEILAPWKDNINKCLEICMKNSGTIAAYEGYPEIQHSVIESFCIQYHGERGR